MLTLKKNTPKIDDFTTRENLTLVLEKVGYHKEKKVILNLFILKLKKKIFLDKLEESEIRDELLMFRGIGNWTCDMVLIFFLQKMNVYPKTDLVIKKNLYKIM